jgi:hypothetical protein
VREFTLAHLRWFDLTLGLKRLAKTRAMPWPDEPTGATYHKMDGEAFAAPILCATQEMNG